MTLLWTSKAVLVGLSGGDPSLSRQESSIFLHEAPVAAWRMGKQTWGAADLADDP
jgi:hypothetical protein